MSVAGIANDVKTSHKITLITVIIGDKITLNTVLDIVEGSRYVSQGYGTA